MSSETIPERFPEQTIEAAHPNLLQSVFGVGFVPRAISGIATTLAGSLGTSSLRWLGALANATILYTGNFFTSLARAASGSDYTLTLPNALPASKKYVIVNSTGTISFENTTPQQSSDIVVVTDSDGAEDVVDSVTLDTNGRPVLLGLMPQATHIASQNVVSGDTTGGDDISVELRFYRNSVLIGSAKWESNNLGTNPSILHAISPFWHLDVDSPIGNTTYQLRVVGPGSSKTGTVRFCRFFAYEL